MTNNSCNSYFYILYMLISYFNYNIPRLIQKIQNNHQQQYFFFNLIKYSLEENII